MRSKICHTILKSHNSWPAIVSSFAFELILNIIWFVSDIEYFVCLKIVEILKETESDSKNIFGYYSSQRMKDWIEIIKLYEKDNIYLGFGQSFAVFEFELNLNFIFSRFGTDSDPKC